MDFDSPDQDVEKEFPGLYASESAAGRKKDDEDCKMFLGNSLFPCLSAKIVVFSFIK